jgi:hypothetical protein
MAREERAGGPNRRAFSEELSLCADERGKIESPLLVFVGPPRCPLRTEIRRRSPRLRSD